MHVTCHRCGIDFEPRMAFDKRAGKHYADMRCKRCEALRMRKSRKAGKGQFVYAKSLARRRGFEWVLTEEEYMALRGQRCHYCGFPVSSTGMAIDRKDCRFGYVPGNVVACCTDCNLAKNANFTYDEMLLLGKVIGEIKVRRQERGEESPEPNRSIGCPRKY